MRPTIAVTPAVRRSSESEGRRRLAGLVIVAVGIVVVFVPAAWLASDRFGAWGAALQAVAAFLAVVLAVVAFQRQTEQTERALDAALAANNHAEQAIRVAERTSEQTAVLARDDHDARLLLHIHSYLSSSDLMDARRRLRMSATVGRDGHLLPLNFTAGGATTDEADRIAGSYDQAGLILHLNATSVDTRNAFLTSSWGRSIVDQYEMLAGFLNDKRGSGRTGRQFFAHFVWMAEEAALKHRGKPGERQQRLARVISGGQTGVDRAALRFAKDHGIPYGGWCPCDGWAEDRLPPSSIRDDYPMLVETPTSDPSQRTEWNVRDSDATLLVTVAGVPSPGTTETLKLIEQFRRPSLTLTKLNTAEARELVAWVKLLPRGSSVNIAGPRGSEDVTVEDRLYTFLSEHLAELRDVGS